MTHPYIWMSKPALWITFALITLATLVVGNILQQKGNPLSTQKVPAGILAIEMPWSGEKARAIVEAWGADLVAAAKKQVMVDFLFLLLYPLFFSIACVLLALILPEKLQLIGLMVSWGVLLAGLLDAIENIAILLMLEGNFATPVPQVATIAAAVKFTLVIGAVGFLGIGGITAIISRLKGL